ncbi:MAG: LemA family protein [Sciscionella sp.]
MTAVIIVLVVIVVIILLIAIYLVSAKNTFARQDNTVQESWRQIDVELQRRHDVIENLVQTIAQQVGNITETEAVKQVVSARYQAMQVHGQGPAMQSQAEQTLNGALNNFFQVTENYPQLQGNDAYRQLREQLVECEDRIAAGRRFYNGNVKAYNTRFDTFPASMLKGGHQKAQYFEVDDPQVRANPSVSGLFNQSFAGQGGQHPPSQQQSGYPAQLPQAQPQFGQQPGYPQQGQRVPPPQPPQQQPGYPQPPQQPGPYGPPPGQ